MNALINFVVALTLMTMSDNLFATDYPIRINKDSNLLREGNLLDVQQLGVSVEIDELGYHGDVATHYLISFEYEICKFNSSGYSIGIALINQENKLLVSKLPNIFNENALVDLDDNCVKEVYSKKIVIDKALSMSLVAESQKNSFWVVLP